MVKSLNVISAVTGYDVVFVSVTVDTVGSPDVSAPVVTVTVTVTGSQVPLLITSVVIDPLG